MNKKIFIKTKTFLFLMCVFALLTFNSTVFAEEHKKFLLYFYNSEDITNPVGDTLERLIRVSLSNNLSEKYSSITYIDEKATELSELPAFINDLSSRGTIDIIISHTDKEFSFKEIDEDNYYQKVSSFYSTLYGKVKLFYILNTDDAKNLFKDVFPKQLITQTSDNSLGKISLLAFVHEFGEGLYVSNAAQKAYYTTTEMAGSLGESVPIDLVAWAKTIRYISIGEQTSISDIEPKTLNSPLDAEIHVIGEEAPLFQILPKKFNLKMNQILVFMHSNLRTMAHILFPSVKYKNIEGKESVLTTISGDQLRYIFANYLHYLGYEANVFLENIENLNITVTGKFSSTVIIKNKQAIDIKTRSKVPKKQLYGFRTSEWIYTKFVFDEKEQTYSISPINGLTAYLNVPLFDDIKPTGITISAITGKVHINAAMMAGDTVFWSSSIEAKLPQGVLDIFPTSTIASK